MLFICDFRVPDQGLEIGCASRVRFQALHVTFSPNLRTLLLATLDAQGQYIGSSATLASRGRSRSRASSVFKLSREAIARMAVTSA